MLEIRKIRKYYENNLLLDDISFTLGADETVLPAGTLRRAARAPCCASSPGWRNPKAGKCCGMDRISLRNRRTCAISA